MSSTNSPQDTQSNANPEVKSGKPNTGLGSDMATLASLLTQCQESQNPQTEDQESDDHQVAELLKQLTAADGIATGAEEKLDAIIGNLDLLLTALEKTEPVDGGSEPPQSVTTATAEEKGSSHP